MAELRRLAAITYPAMAQKPRISQGLKADNWIDYFGEPPKRSEVERRTLGDSPDQLPANTAAEYAAVEQSTTSPYYTSRGRAGGAVPGREKIEAPYVISNDKCPLFSTL